MFDATKFDEEIAKELRGYVKAHNSQLKSRYRAAEPDK